MITRAIFRDEAVARPEPRSAPRAEARAWAGARVGGASEGRRCWARALLVVALALQGRAVLAAPAAIPANAPVPATAEASAETTSDAPGVTIVLIGPRARCEDAQKLMQSAAGGAGALTWLFFVEPSASTEELAKSGEAAPMLFVDLRDARAARLVIARPGAARVMRTVTAEGDTAPDDRADSEAVLQETVAQIVAASLRDLAAGRDPLVSPLPFVATSPPSPAATPAPQPALPAKTRDALVAAAAVPRSLDPSLWQGRWAFDMATGVHTSPFCWGPSSDCSAHPSWGVSLDGRRETRHLALGLRASFEAAEQSGDAASWLATRLHSLVLTGAWAHHVGWFGYALGATAGWLVVRQESAPPRRNAPVVSRFPGAYDTSWAMGAVAGPYVDLTAALGPRSFLVLRVAYPWAFMNLTDGYSTSWHAEGYFQALGGLGARL